MTARRYLALKIESSQAINEEEFKGTVWRAILQLFGEYGASKTGLIVISHDVASNCAVLKCVNSAIDIVRASLASITEINAKPVAVHVLGVSGTLKSLRKKFPPH
jgi:ribonuclease P/MRP protein subunit POP5